MTNLLYAFPRRNRFTHFYSFGQRPFTTLCSTETNAAKLSTPTEYAVKLRNTPNRCTILTRTDNETNKYERRRQKTHTKKNTKCRQRRESDYKHCFMEAFSRSSWESRCPGNQENLWKMPQSIFLVLKPFKEPQAKVMIQK